MRDPVQLAKHLANVNNCKSKYLLLDYKQSFLSSHPEQVYTKKFLPLCCNSYFCPKCSAKKQQQICDRYKKFSKKSTWRFLTLTLRNDGTNQADNLKSFNSYFNNFMTSIRKFYPSARWLRVIEISKNGMIHCHILIDVYIPHLRIKSLWKKASGSFIVDIRKSNSIDVAVQYLSKYISKFQLNQKNNELFYLLNVKRVSWSQNFERVLKEKIFEALPEFTSFDLDRVLNLFRISDIFKSRAREKIDVSLLPFSFSKLL